MSRSRRFAALLLLLPVFFILGNRLNAETPAIPEKAIAALVQPYLDAEIVTGVSIGVVSGDRTWTGNFGQLSKQSGKTPGKTTVYEIGSESKVFTGILLAHAVETGRLKLDQSIGSLIPKLNKTNKQVGESILLKHLSMHVSGLPRMPDNFAPADPGNPFADYDRGRLIEFLCRVKPGRAPGEASEYSNLAAGLLGDLLATEAKVDYEKLLKRTITEPLRMNDTTLSLSEDQSARMAPPHNVDQAADKRWDFDALAGAGGIRSTTADMIRFIQANLDPPDDALGRAINLAWKQHLPATGKDFAMGLGWHIARDGSTRWHNGQTGGYHSMLLINRTLDVGVIVLCNTATPEVDAIGESIIQTLAGIDVKPRTFAATKKVDPKVVARLVGRYQLVPNFVLDVRADGERLYVQATGQQEFRVYSESETSWKYKVVDAKLTFELPESGPCTAVTLHQNGRDMKGQRTE